MVHVLVPDETVSFQGIGIDVLQDFVEGISINNVSAESKVTMPEHAIGVVFVNHFQLKRERSVHRRFPVILGQTKEA